MPMNRQMTSVRAGVEFVAQSPAMRDVLQQVDLVRDSSVAVLITGERGSGRETVARTIHGNGSRSGEPFVHVDCASLPAEVLKEVLFVAVGKRRRQRLQPFA